MKHIHSIKLRNFNRAIDIRLKSLFVSIKLQEIPLQLNKKLP